MLLEFKFVVPANVCNMNLHVLIFIVSFSVAITVALHLNNGDGFDGPIVHTKNGQVMGTIESTLLDHRKYYAFRGIPYGRAPIDALRFKAPVKAAPWTGVWNGSNFGSPCAQPTMYMNNFYGHEDCLTLNVFSSGKQPKFIANDCTSRTYQIRLVY